MHDFIFIMFSENNFRVGCYFFTAFWALSMLNQILRGNK